MKRAHMPFAAVGTSPTYTGRAGCRRRVALMACAGRRSPLSHFPPPFSTWRPQGRGALQRRFRAPWRPAACSAPAREVTVLNWSGSRRGRRCSSRLRLLLPRASLRIATVCGWQSEEASSEAIAVSVALEQQLFQRKRPVPSTTFLPSACTWGGLHLPPSAAAHSPPPLCAAAQPRSRTLVARRAGRSGRLRAKPRRCRARHSRRWRGLRLWSPRSWRWRRRRRRRWRRRRRQRRQRRRRRRRRSGCRRRAAAAAAAGAEDGRCSCCRARAGCSAQRHVAQLPVQRAGRGRGWLWSTSRVDVAGTASASLYSARPCASSRRASLTRATCSTERHPHAVRVPGAVVGDARHRAAAPSRPAARRVSRARVRRRARRAAARCRTPWATRPRT